MVGIKFATGLLAAFLVAPLLASAEESVLAEQQRYRDKYQTCIFYEVKPGDYCYKIAIYNGITYQQFLKQNPGINCTNLQVGQSVCLVPLKMPGWSSGWDNNGYDTEDDNDDIYQEAKASHLNCSNSYTVKEGDMCVSIAAHNDIPVGKLVDANKSLPSWKGCSKLYAGQTICLE
ncbi:hypothetical protein GGI11_004587 [Coemansia sp. RSA 2049]|nr:hypothetical protein H4217_007946 [Coemansia sp. RSA 1939]KAJ2512907.1 hypothetical protein GGI11_004587 [Coemansia sp. RSA 2049]KAJ2604843.1 hypothetical protein EV177_006295 [Coemansia sp. RSA 1804]